MLPELVWVVLLGMLAGLLADKLWKGSGFGLPGDLVVGILGSLLGSFIFDNISGLLGLGAYGLIGRLVVAIGRLVVAVVGALVLLWLIRLIKKS
jgi:uncharacterized membrane protein YeaQ/YmgE (transglycosylase-associated protein family)